MALPKLPLAIFTKSKQLISGEWANAITNLLTSSKTGITATAGGTAVTSVQLNDSYNEITTVATANDGVVLPPAKAGLRIGVLNSDAADSLRVFGNGTDTIKTGAGAAAASSDLAAVTGALFVCFKDGLWIRFTSA